MGRFLRGLKSIKCPSLEVPRAQQRIKRDIDLIRIAEKVIAIGIGQTLGIHEALKAGFKVGIVWIQPIVEPHDHNLRRARGGRRGGADFEDAIGAADDGPLFDLVVFKVIEAQAARVRRPRCTGNNRLSDIAGVKGVGSAFCNGGKRCSVFWVLQACARFEGFAVRVKVRR